MATNLSDIKVVKGSKTEHFRKGQGRGTGNGKTAGKGQKGQGAHAHTKKHGFEGGQMPLARRIPKFGFKNISRKEYAIINLKDLNRFEEGTVVTPELIVSSGLVKDELSGIKVLGVGVLEKKLEIHAHKFSKTALAAIEKLGGKAEVVK